MSEDKSLPHRPISMDQKRIDRFWTYVEKTDNCWEWKGCKNKQGYGRFGIASSKCMNAHRISWFLAYGQIPYRHFICHTCDNPTCVRPDHLFAGTRQDNVNDMMIKKRSRHFKNSEYYGVIWKERYDGPNRNGRWHSVIWIDGEMKTLAAHTSILEAARNYDRIAYIKYGERKLLNFPNEYTNE